MAQLPVRKGTVLGLDVGSGSCGYALLDGEQIALCGVRLFETGSLTHKNESKQRHRRLARATRVRLRRHRQRRAAVRHLLSARGLPDPVAEAGAVEPLCCRAEGLDRRLSPSEWAAALYAIAKRRGLHGQLRPGETLPPFVEDEAFRAQVRRNTAEAEQFRTVGEMLMRHPRYSASKRNRPGSYHAVFPAALLRAEVQQLFASQRAVGNPATDAAFEAEYLDTAFAAAGPGDGEARVGACPFLPDHRRGARHTPAIERYLFLDVLTKLRVVDGTEFRRLTPAELGLADAQFGGQATVSLADLRAWLGWSADIRPVREVAEDDDLVTPAGAAAGTVALRAVLGERRFAALAAAPGLLDAIAAVMAFRNSADRWREGLAGLGLDPAAIAALITAAEAGALAVLRGAGLVSAAAATAIAGHLVNGDLFHDAAIAAGFDPLAKERAILHTIQNPCVVRSVGQALRQVQAVLRDRGYRPARIHVEVAEDLAANGAKRAEIAARRVAVHKLRESARVALAAFMPVSQITSAMIERYLMWQEQQGCCAYSGQPISMRDLLDRTAVQVDHIRPQGRSGDNSRDNCVVCLASLNQDKGARTPFEWRGSDQRWWQAFAQRVEGSRLSSRKQRYLLQRHFAEREARILRRNLNDTRYTARVLLTALQALYPEGQHQRRLFARPGHATAALREAWGLVKDRDDPRHHALDAIVVAATGNKAMAALTGGAAVAMAIPWAGFADDVAVALDAVLPSRSERRRGRGQAHGMTIRRVRERPGGEPQVYERRPIWRLRECDLARIPDPEMNQPLIESLRSWIAAGQPTDRPPLGPSGTPVRRVRLLVVGSTGIPRDGLAVNGGIAAFGEFARVDIYYGEGRYVAVPVNRSDIATLPAPPRRANVAGALRQDWPEIGDDYAFCFSLYRGSYVEVQGRRRVTRAGYIRSFDTYKSQLYLTGTGTLSGMVKVGIASASVMRKFAIDRLGRMSEVRGEALTWRGRTVACCTLVRPPLQATSLREVA